MQTKWLRPTYHYLSESGIGIQAAIGCMNRTVQPFKADSEGLIHTRQKQHLQWDYRMIACSTLQTYVYTICETRIGYCRASRLITQLSAAKMSSELTSAGFCDHLPAHQDGTKHLVVLSLLQIHGNPRTLSSQHVCLDHHYRHT